METYSNLANLLRSKLQHMVWRDVIMWHVLDVHPLTEQVQNSVWFGVGGRVYQSVTEVGYTRASPMPEAS